MNPRVSIVMPVLNGERYLGQAVDSILAQTYKNYDLVAVDDGSTDSTRALLHQYADRPMLRYLHHPERKGIAVSVNDGIRNATCEYITFLDHDDIWCPEMLETPVGHLDRHPDVGMAHFDFQTNDADGNVLVSAFLRPVICALPVAILAYAFSVTVVTPSSLLFAAEAAIICGILAVVAYLLCLDRWPRGVQLDKAGVVIHREVALHGS